MVFATKRTSEESVNNTTTRNILITCGEDPVGYRLVHSLLRHKNSNNSTGMVRVGGIRHPVVLQEFQDLKNLQVDSSFDWNNPTTFGDALREIHTVVVILPPPLSSDKTPDQFAAFLQACKHSGSVTHIVKLSLMHALVAEASDRLKNAGTIKRVQDDPFLKVPLVQVHRACDLKVIKLSFNYTIFFVHHSMATPLLYQLDKNTNKLTGVAPPDKAIRYISPTDVAQVVLQAILHSKDQAKKNFHRQGWSLVGPAPGSTGEKFAQALQAQYVQATSFAAYLASLKASHNAAALEMGHLEGTKLSSFDAGAAHGQVFAKLVPPDIHEQESLADYLANTKAMTPQERAALKNIGD